MSPRTFLLAGCLVAASAFAMTTITPVRVTRDAPAAPVMCSDVPCFTLRERNDAIASHNAQTHADHRYLAIGDSITEYAVLETLCGAAPINAGISGATTSTWIERARPLADTIKPDFVIVALGTNDAYLDRIAGYSERLDAVLDALKPYKTIVIPPPPSPDLKYAARFGQFTAIAADKPNAAAPLPSAVTVDGVHLTAQDYDAWKAALRTKVTTAICPGRAS